MDLHDYRITLDSRSLLCLMRAGRPIFYGTGLECRMHLRYLYLRCWTPQTYVR